MDWNAIQQYLPLYQKAAVLTVRLGVAGIIFAIIIGLVCAMIQYDKVPVLRQIGLSLLAAPPVYLAAWLIRKAGA